ncbi:MAG: D-alanyl-D-alanine carboxypeptidase/D-alanyl-D-alanine-endopeptidase, partial [Gemmatimonadaceae bacterium]|nr:D-alanyl-D-alanine carboxypeptidase/D-alanyl-D-alanine-endopeptidase [Gemmatimonadaceae bacterium]
RGAGVRHVTGDIIADASAFEARRIPDGWLTRYAGAAYAAPFSALSLNENIVIVGITPSNGRATIALEPSTHALSISNTVRVVGGTAAKLSISLSGENLVVVSGTIGARAGTKRYQLVVSDPALFTAGAFRSALEAEGITVDGRVIAGRTPPTAALLTSLPSPPLSRLVSTMNRESINVYAEMLWRGAARGSDRTHLGSTENANRTLQEFLTQRVGVTAGAVTATDGSGLSVLDRVTARSLVQLLAHAHESPWASAFHASLPVAGESELLRRRMRDTPAQGNLHAKTGTTNEVIGLSGYVTAENGEIVAFAFLYNGLDRWHALETIDAMGPTIASFSR